MPIIHKYELPPVLKGVFTVSRYAKFLNCKADTLRRRDLRLGRPFARTCSKAFYKSKIHAAFLDAGERDPYTGDKIRWDLIGEWDNKKDEFIRLLIAGALREKRAEKARSLNKRSRSNRAFGAFSRDLFLKPTVDHSDPYGDELAFEICTWIVNSSKTLMNPGEFVAFCRKVARHRSRK